MISGPGNSAATSIAVCFGRKRTVSTILEEPERPTGTLFDCTSTARGRGRSILAHQLHGSLNDSFGFFHTYCMYHSLTYHSLCIVIMHAVSDVPQRAAGGRRQGLASRVWRLGFRGGFRGCRFRRTGGPRGGGEHDHVVVVHVVLPGLTTGEEPPL